MATKKLVPLTYNAPSNDTLEVGELAIAGGETVEVPSDIAELCLADPTLDVTVGEEGATQTEASDGEGQELDKETDNA